jgi:hypothetical protein
LAVTRLKVEVQEWVCGAGEWRILGKGVES